MRLRSLLGFCLLMGIAFACCPRERRRLVSWRCLVYGSLLQFLLAIVILDTRCRSFFGFANDLVDGLLSHATAGAQLVFGVLVNQQKLGEIFGPQNSVIFAIQQIGPVIIFFSALMAVAYQVGLMQRLVGLVARAVVRVMETSGAETMSAVGNIFLGMVEAPLMIRPYLPKLTRSELLCVMVCGLSNVAGTVLAVYVSFLRNAVPNVAGHLIAMSVMSAPAGLVIAKLMLPEAADEVPETRGRVELTSERAYSGILDALSGGASEGLNISLNVVALLIAMVATVHFGNAVIGYPAVLHNQRLLSRAGLHDDQLDPGAAPAVQHALDNLGARGHAWTPPTFQHLAGYAFRPLAWMLGVPYHDIPKVGELLGERTVLNEFIAYLDMAATLKDDPSALTARGALLASYALCAFANFGSVAIMIGGIAAMIPSRRRELAELGIPALIGGTLAACLTACAVGVLI